MPYLILLAISLINLAYNKIGKDKRAAKSGSNKSDGMRDLILPPDTVNIKWHPDEYERQRSKDRFKWSKDGPVWLGTMFALMAVLISVASIKEAGRTTDAINGQLREMREQRLLTIKQVRANIRRTDLQVVAVREGAAIVAYDINPVWKNFGVAEAINVRGWFDIASVDIDKVDPNRFSDSCPKINKPNMVILESSVAGTSTFRQTEQRYKASAFSSAFSSAIEGKSYIFVAGHMEYRDSFYIDQRFFDDWCVIISANEMAKGNNYVVEVRDDAKVAPVTEDQK